MSKIEELKNRITETTAQLESEERKVQELPIQAGHLAAEGKQKESDSIFDQAEKAQLQVKRLSATLEALEEQLREEKRKAKENLFALRMSESETEAEKAEKELLKKTEKLVEVWNEILDIKSDIVGLSGAKILTGFFEEYKPAGRVSAFNGSKIPASEIDFSKMTKHILSTKKSLINIKYRSLKDDIESGVLR